MSRFPQVPTFGERIQAVRKGPATPEKEAFLKAWNAAEINTTEAIELLVAAESSQTAHNLTTQDREGGR